LWKSNNIHAAPNENNLIEFAKDQAEEHIKREVFVSQSVRDYVKLISSGRQTDY